MKAMMKANRHRVPYRAWRQVDGQVRGLHGSLRRGVRHLFCASCRGNPHGALLPHFMAIWFSCIKPLADGFEDWWKRK